MTSDSDEKIIFQQSWNKMKHSLHSEGYREGSSSGRDMTFQQGFDIGYSKGFQAGYALGLHNGVLRCLKSDASVLDNTIKEHLSAVEEVEKASRGLCVLCSQERVGNPSIDSTGRNEETGQLGDIKVTQEKIVSDKRTHIMTDNYSSVLNCIGLDSLFNNN